METRLAPSDAMLEACGGSDFFAAASGRRINYRKLLFTLKPCREPEIKPGARAAYLPIEQGDDRSLWR